MKTFALSAALIFSAAAAHAAAAGPVADVTVSIGPGLREKAEVYGARDLQRLAAELEADVETALAREGRLGQDGGRLELVLADAVPTRPTFEQMSDRTELSMQSFGTGGATIEGRFVHADGSSEPVAFRWYENDIRWSQNAGTWSDAERAFELFARDFARDR
ncbi:MAG TPA: hypothetical protein VD929_02310 [Caulobacteraceae bacterium]|nr:hypothetical protein [Caulobacteraceae bacterium]